MHEIADALSKIGLFKGGSNGYDLERAPLRIEGLIMLIRLLGEEDAAWAQSPVHPFTDVPKWADSQAVRMVAYGYNKGYANGYLNNRFGATDNILATQYLTFVLRALGYSDSKGDFVWNQSIEKALEIGLINSELAYKYKTQTFTRGDLVVVSYRALMCKMKTGDNLLLLELVEKDAITVLQASEILSLTKKYIVK